MSASPEHGEAAAAQGTAALRAEKWKPGDDIPEWLYIHDGWFAVALAMDGTELFSNDRGKTWWWRGRSVTRLTRRLIDAGLIEVKAAGSIGSDTRQGVNTPELMLIARELLKEQIDGFWPEIAAADAHPQGPAAGLAAFREESARKQREWMASH